MSKRKRPRVTIHEWALQHGWTVTRGNAGVYYVQDVDGKNLPCDKYREPFFRTEARAWRTLAAIRSRDELREKLRQVLGNLADTMESQVRETQK